MAESVWAGSLLGPSAGRLRSGSLEVGAPRALSDLPTPSQRVGAVVVAHDQIALAQQCVTALADELDVHDIVVVINRPDAIPSGALATVEACVGSLVLNPDELGYGANLNRGIRKLSGDVSFYLLMNDDVIPRRGSVAALVECLAANAPAGMVAPELIGPDGELQSVRRRFPSLKTEIQEAIIVPGRWMPTGHALVLPSEAHSSEVDWAVGAVLLVRANAFAQVGGFDESFFLYSEEVDLSLRLRNSGWKTYVCPAALMDHLGGASTSGPAFPRMLVAARWQFIKKHWSAGNRALLIAALGATYAWNTVYVLGRIALQPGQRREKTQMWRQGGPPGSVPVRHRRQGVTADGSFSSRNPAVSPSP